MKGYNCFEVKKFLSVEERKRRKNNLLRELAESQKIKGGRTLRRDAFIEEFLELLYRHQDVTNSFEQMLFHEYMIQMEENKSD